MQLKQVFLQFQLIFIWVWFNFWSNSIGAGRFDLVPKLHGKILLAQFFFSYFFSKLAKQRMCLFYSCELFIFIQKHFWLFWFANQCFHERITNFDWRLKMNLTLFSGKIAMNFCPISLHFWFFLSFRTFFRCASSIEFNFHRSHKIIANLNFKYKNLTQFTVFQC